MVLLTRRAALLPVIKYDMPHPLPVMDRPCRYGLNCFFALRNSVFCAPQQGQDSRGKTAGRGMQISVASGGRPHLQPLLLQLQIELQLLLPCDAGIWGNQQAVKPGRCLAQPGHAPAPGKLGSRKHVLPQLSAPA